MPATTSTEPCRLSVWPVTLGEAEMMYLGQTLRKATARLKQNMDRRWGFPTSYRANARSVSRATLLRARKCLGRLGQLCPHHMDRQALQALSEFRILGGKRFDDIGR